ncbi:MAG TPA: Flp pilus assembly protein CpaB [Pirellulales bacterium]|nr:Flp pilus assembly protein CpaB [Pirellulales bacterium]
MSLRTVLIGVFALVFGVAASIGVYAVSRAKSGKSDVETVSVLVAKSDVPRGQTLSADLLELRRWPKESVPEGVVTEMAAALDRTVLIPMAKGELLLNAKLAAKGAGRGLAAIIPPGMRAVTIQTPNIATGVAGFVLPGNKVDVLLTVSGQSLDDSTGGASTFTLLQNVEILAVDQRIDAPQENKMDPKELRSVTLLVTPADAARLELGQNKGTLHLALRNPGDKATAVVETVTLSGLNTRLSGPASAPPAGMLLGAELAGKEDAKQAAAKQPKLARRVRTLRGMQSSTVEFQTSHADEELPQSADLSPAGKRATDGGANPSR